MAIRTSAKRQWFYNQAMRSALLFALTLSCASLCWAQPAVTAPAPQLPASSSAGAIEKRTEHIHIEDAGSRIDELRVGGETRSIHVQPKGDMPAYQVAPASGERSWKILGF